MSGIIVPIVVKLWDQIASIFLNALFLQNIPINQSQSYLGIILFAVVLVIGISLSQYFLKTKKQKPIEVPPAGIQYDQIACPHCNHPNIVYPPMKKYKEIVLSECKDKTGEEDHNIKSEAKCPNCQKKFEFYWCTGHTFIISAGRRR